MLNDKIEEVQSFIFGVNRMPPWFSSCRYRLIDNGKSGVFIESKGVTYKALVGDIIFRQKNGNIFTLTKEESAKYYYIEWVEGIQLFERELVIYKGLVYEVLSNIISAKKTPDKSNSYEFKLDTNKSTNEIIIFSYGMNCIAGNKYKYDGKLWLCKETMSPCTVKPDTNNQYWELVKEE